jgi:hypothetical protein
MVVAEELGMGVLTGKQRWSRLARGTGRAFVERQAGDGAAVV